MAPRRRLVPQSLPGADNDLSDALRPLNGNREIRLAKLLRTKDYKIEIRLEHWPLDDKDLPQFHALSYTWGDPYDSDTGSVFYNGEPYPVTSNLWEGLSHLRSSKEDRYFWIDQLCINQRDNAEKSQQIPLMQSIYQKASGVTAWLGIEDESTGDLLQYISWAVGKQLQNQEKIDLGPYLDFTETRHLSRGIRALIRFVSRPWFSRIWVVQEASAQKNLTLQLSKFKIPFSTLAAVVDRTNDILIDSNPSTAPATDGRKTYFSFLRACPSIQSVGTPGLRTLKELIEKFCTWDSSEPRDKVYALLGLASDRGLYPAPDYDLPLRQINRDISSIWLSQSHLHALTTLSFAVAGTYPPPKHSSTPSWVVDWSQFSPQNPISPLRNNYKFHAGGALPSSPPPYTFNGTTLSLPGLTIDKITAVSSPLHNFTLQSGEWLSSARQILKDHLTSLRKRPSSPQEIDHSLSHLLTLDGKSSLYTSSTSYEPEHFLSLIDTDLTENKMRIAYSSHGYTRYHDVDGEPYFDLGVSPFIGRLEGAGLWPDIFSDEDQRKQDEGRDRQEEAAERVYRDAALAINVYQCVVRTEEGRVGVAKSGVEGGDEVVVFQGGRMPFVVKRGEKGVRVLSEAYVRGVMCGEAVGGREWGCIEVV